MDERPEEMDELFRQVRRLGPPRGARERVLARAEDEAMGGKRRARWLALGGLAVAAATAVLLVSWVVPRLTPSARVLFAVDARSPDGALHAGDRWRTGRIDVGQRGRFGFALERAEISAEGPAELEIDRGALVVHDGEATIDGTLDVRGGGCRASLDGRATVARSFEVLQITVFAGSVEVHRPSVSCSIVDLTGPVVAANGSGGAARANGRSLEAQGGDDGVTRAVEPRAEPRDEPASSSRRATRGRRTPPSDLSRQVEAYRHALTLRGSDDASAIAEWHEMRRRWPRSPLRHEIDLNVVDALSRLGRDAEARAEARRFLRLYPRSSKTDAVRRIAAQP